MNAARLRERECEREREGAKVKRCEGLKNSDFGFWILDGEGVAGGW